MAKIINKTNEMLAVYGPKTVAEWDTTLYLLPSNCETPNGWDCDGIFIPNNRVADQLLGSNLQGPAAIKYSGSLDRTITKEGNKYKCPANQGAYSTNDSRCPTDDVVPLTPRWVCWSIPNLKQEDINSLPLVPQAVCNT